MAASKKGAAKKGAAKKAAAKEPAEEPAARKAPRGKAAKAEAPEGAPAPAPAPGAPPAAEGKAPVQKESLVIPMDVYASRKEAIKAPIKEHGLKWQFLGEGKGRYHKEGVNLFVQFQDDGVHYALWGDDRATIDALLGAWRNLLGDRVLAKAAEAGEKAEEKRQEAQESEAMKLWRLQQPQRRPGEPDFFFKKRTQEWEAKKPA